VTRVSDRGEDCGDLLAVGGRHEPKSIKSSLSSAGPGGPRGHRTIRALAAGRPLLPALNGLAAAVGRGRLLPGLRDRRNSAALTSRLRTPADRAGRVTHPRPRAPAVRSPDHHRTAVDQHQRLRPDRPPRPTRATDLRSLWLQHRRPGRRTRPSRPAGTGQGRQSRARPTPTRDSASDRPRRRRPHRRTDPAQHARRPDGPARRHPPAQALGHLRRDPDTADASVESARGAVSVLPPVRFPGPLAEPAVPISRQRALHGLCR
jgi:hypothetical protein